MCRIFTEPIFVILSSWEKMFGEDHISISCLAQPGSEYDLGFNQNWHAIFRHLDTQVWLFIAQTFSVFGGACLLKPNQYHNYKPDTAV